MMLGAGQVLTPAKDTITLGDDRTQLPRWAVAGPLPHLRHALREKSGAQSAAEIDQDAFASRDRQLLALKAAMA